MKRLCYSIKIRPSLLFLVVTLSFSGCWSSPSKSKNIKKSEKWETISASSDKNQNSEAATDSDYKQVVIKESEIKSGGFQANLPPGFFMPDDDVGKKMIKEYGALFIARGGVIPPKRVIFKSDSEVEEFQAAIAKSSENIGGLNVELQSSAMNALKEAINEAKQMRLTITPRGADSAKRNYSDTVALWASRVNPGLAYWAGKRKISEAEANRIRALLPTEQITEIFRLEEQKIYFSKDFLKSIVYSVAPPGTSQHLSMLALDVSEHDNARVREILAKHGWFQTVVSDLPHFTYLGTSENELSQLGLKKINSGGRSFWIPDF